MGDPYRSARALLRCPRCGDDLDSIHDGLAACLTCHGMWIESPALVAAFGSRSWPVGTNAWWKRELECPVCSREMEAVMANGILIDRCDHHGAWFDPGELGRLMGAPQSDELAELHRRIAPDETMPALVARQRIREAERAEQRGEADARALQAQNREAEVLALRATVERLRRELDAAEIALGAALRRQ